MHWSLKYMHDQKCVFDQTCILGGGYWSSEEHAAGQSSELGCDRERQSISGAHAQSLILISPAVEDGEGGGVSRVQGRVGREGNAKHEEMRQSNSIYLCVLVLWALKLHVCSSRWMIRPSRNPSNAILIPPWNSPHWINNTIAVTAGKWYKFIHDFLAIAVLFWRAAKRQPLWPPPSSERINIKITCL